MRATSLVTVLFIFVSLALASTSTAEQTLDLVRKNPRTWQTIDSKVKAQLGFSHKRTSFTCTGQHLEGFQRYALIQHDETTPRGQGYIIALGETNASGDIRLKGNWHHWHGKIWLIIADDVSGNAGDETIDHLIHWQPKRYLFESRVLL